MATVATEKCKLAGCVDKLLMEVVPTIRQTSMLANENAMTSQKQLVGVGQINDAMAQPNQTMLQNPSASAELAVTAAEMGSQAQQLQQIMTFFHPDDSEQRPT